MEPRKCTKRRYRDEITAKLALFNIQMKDKPGHHERRVYECGLCGKWHTTSKELRE
jgi:hypothetical protein